MSSDADYLRLLSIFHYVVGGILALFSLFPVFHLAFGIAIVTGALGNETPQQGPPELVGWVLIGIASAIIASGLGIAACVVVAGRKLARYESYVYCLVIAGIECIFMPLGTVLGVFTIIVLLRSGAKSLFGVDDGAQKAVDSPPSG